MPINFNQPPYYDDFTKDDLVYKLLFQPGRAVQARELTQIQSLLQDQISSLGSHIFKDGSLVFGGELNYDKTNTKWLAIKALDFKDSPNLIRSITPGLFIRRSAQAEEVSWNPRTYGKITEVIPAENGEPDTIFFQWEEGEPEEGQSGFGSNENLIIYDQDRQVARFPITTLAKNADDKAIHYGTASKLSVKPGIYFWKGLFIRSTGGSIVLSKYEQNTTYRIGFSVDEIINTSNPKSLDPASGSSNYAAPGADRYEIKLQLQKYGPGSLPIDETILENFIEIARVVDGDLITTPQDQTIYNVLADKLAQRTYEESGNYITKPYDITVRNKASKDNPKLIVKMSDGISYVKGYRRSLTKQNTIEIDKGRDVQTASIEVPHWYGDNRVSIYDHANSSMTNNKENANGLFTIGSGAGFYTSNAWYGERGAAVSLHCVPHDQVKDYSLTDQWKWNSTLVGTARPTQMTYDRGATNRSARANRPGMVYNLWLDDFNSSPITNAVSVTNIINDVTAYGNSEFGVFHFNAPSTAHGITTNDHISITGQSSWDTFTGATVSHVNTTAILVAGDYSGFTASDTDGLSLSRTTGNTTGLNTVVLNEYSSAAWNDSYTGATIRINDGTRWSEPRTIIGYAGTTAQAETLWKNRVNTDAPWSKRATVILNRDLDIAPVSGYAYELTLTAKQARSVVHNYNKSTTGAEQYPALLSQMWNIDPISGIVNNENPRGWWSTQTLGRVATSDRSKLTDEFYGGRMGGDCIYNRFGKEQEDALLFPTGKMATKSVMTVGELDSGLTSKTYLYYTEYIKYAPTGTGATQTFTLPADSYYDFSVAGPDIYPYTSQTITNTDQIRANFALVNRTTGEILTSYITQVVIDNSAVATAAVTLAESGKYVVGKDYILNTQVRLKNVTPAYKKLVTASTTNTISLPSDGDLTSFGRGQILIDSAAYETTQGSHISLKKPDIFKLKKVIHNVDNADANTDLANTQLDITDRFALDTGQRNSFYDNGSIELKGTAPTGNLLVCFDYFQRMDKPKSDDTREENLDSPSYFAVDSYQTTTDVTFSEPASISFAAGDLVTANDGAIGYIVDFANTVSGGYAKARIEDVVGNFNVDEFITKGDAAGKIKTVTTADLRYSEIPSYTSPTGATFMLRNMIDVRAYVSTSSQVSDTISDSMMPLTPANEYMGSRTNVRFGPGWPTLPEDDVERPRVSGDAEISHYTGRIDKIVVTDSGEYTTITGAASDEPIPPREDQDGNKFTIASLEIPPYTSRPDMVQIRPNIALRHTMKDISKLAKRVENLEYYVSLNALELSASELDITLADGTNRFKNGIVVDNFNGSRVKLLGPNNSVCSTGEGVMRPSQETYGNGRGSFDLYYISGGATEDISSGGWKYGEPTHAMIKYDTEEFISQRAATGLESVNPFDLQNFTGELTLTPDTDHWVDSTRLPEYSAVIAGDRDNPIAELSSPEFADLTPAEIARELEKIDGLWEAISGVSAGDDITGTATVYSQNESGGFDVETRARNIELGDVSVQKYTALADIDAAIARAASIDGMMKAIEILPYVRSRDVVVHATGMKPSWPAGLFFENCWIDHLYSPATQIYLKDTNNAFQPEIDGTPERISLSASGGTYTANALLVAVREPEFLNSTITNNNMKVGYIVPEITNADKGLIDWTTYKDGYYASGWLGNIKQYGFQGTDTSITITGRRTSATTTLFGGSSDLYNGHYTGTARNTDSGNTTHIVMSPDAHRYISANFGSSSLSPTSATPNRTLIRIVSGRGEGLECVANNLVGTETVGSETACPVIELRAASDGTNPLDRTVGGGPGIDSTSVYTIRMKSADIKRNGVSQLGYPGHNTNRFGDKIGIMHIPAAYSRSEWTAGSKLIELRDRAYNASHLIKNYASAYYNAGGHRQIFYDDQTLTRLQGIRNSLSAFQINDGDGETIEATDENGTGVLGVVVSVNVVNGTYTAASSQAFQAGPGEVGSVSQTDPNEMSAWQQHVKDLEDMGFVWMEDLKKFVSVY